MPPHNPLVRGLTTTAVTLLIALGAASASRAAADDAVLILDVSEDANVDHGLHEDLADHLVYFTDAEVVDAQCVRAAERTAQLEGAATRRHLEGLVDDAEARYQDFDADGAWTTLQQAGSQMASLDPLAHGPLVSRFCRLSVLVSIDRGDPDGVEDSLQCLVSVQPWYQPAPGQFDPATEGRLEVLRAQLSAGAATLGWDDIPGDTTVVVDGFEVGPDDAVLLVSGVHLIQTEREGYATVRRRISVESETLIPLEPPTVPRWDREARERLRELLDDEERADQDPTVQGLMASCEADRALLMFTEWDDDLRSTTVGLVRARGQSWEYLGRFDTHRLVDHIGEALGPEKAEVTGLHYDKPVMGTLGFAVGGAGRFRAPADERMYAGFGFGLGLQFGLRIKRHFHIGPALSFSLMGSTPSDEDDNNAFVFLETLAWVDIGLESGVVFTPGQTRLTLVAGGGVTFAALSVTEVIVVLGEARTTGGWMGARFTVGFPTSSQVRVGPSLQLHHAIAPLAGEFVGWGGADGGIEWNVSFQTLTQVQLLLALTL